MLLACDYQRTRQRKMGIVKKILPRLLIASWRRKDDWKTLFQNKPSGTTNPVYLPQATPEQNKECVNQQNTVSHNSCSILYPATLEEHPINNNDPVLFWKTCTGKKCINVYTLDLGWYAIEGHLLEQLLKPIHALKKTIYP